MPTYSYACTECDNRFDAVQAFTDDALTTCPKCSGRLRKLFGSVGVVFKGSGFYRNDSRDAVEEHHQRLAAVNRPSRPRRSRRTSLGEVVRQARREVEARQSEVVGELRIVEPSSDRSSSSSSSSSTPPPPPASSYPQAAARTPAATRSDCLAWPHGGIAQSVAADAPGSRHCDRTGRGPSPPDACAAGALVLLAAVAALRPDPADGRDRRRRRGPRPGPGRRAHRRRPSRRITFGDNDSRRFASRRRRPGRVDARRSGPPRRGAHRRPGAQPAARRRRRRARRARGARCTSTDAALLDLVRPGDVVDVLAVSEFRRHRRATDAANGPPRVVATTPWWSWCRAKTKDGGPRRGGAGRAARLRRPTRWRAPRCRRRSR